MDHIFYTLVKSQPYHQTLYSDKDFACVSTQFEGQLSFFVSSQYPHAGVSGGRASGLSVSELKMLIQIPKSHHRPTELESM